MQTGGFPCIYLTSLAIWLRAWSSAEYVRTLVLFRPLPVEVILVKGNFYSQRKCDDFVSFWQQLSNLTRKFSLLGRYNSSTTGAPRPLLTARLPASGYSICFLMSSAAAGIFSDLLAWEFHSKSSFTTSLLPWQTWRSEIPDEDLNFRQSAHDQFTCHACACSIYKKYGFCVSEILLDPISLLRFCQKHCQYVQETETETRGGCCKFSN